MAAVHCFILLFCLCNISACLFFILPGSAAELGVAYYNCLRNATSGTSSNAALSSTFKEHLNWALLNLTKLASDGTKYAIASTTSEGICFSTSPNPSVFDPPCANRGISANSGVDTVYAMFQCRGDQSTQGCVLCMANATATLSQSLCPSSIGARIQLDGCYLRYDNQTFFSPDFGLVKGYCYGQTSDMVALTAIDSLMTNVTTQAPQNNGYATASASSEYALAQCLGYLNESECLQCLTSYNYRLGCDSSLGEQIHLGSCYYRFEPYIFYTASTPPALKVSSPPPTTYPTTQGSKAAVIVGCVVGAVVVMAIMCLTLTLYRRRNHKRRLQVAEDTDSSQPLFKPKAEVFSLHELEVATDHFHFTNKLGEGGFGSVYKGTLQNGQHIAVKKLSVGSQQGKREFMNEVKLITSVQHKNLIKLLGSCVEGPERILVYEYLPNGSVGEQLFGDASKTSTLDWPTRHGIILGMARGLAYLHEESQVCIIHRDIKPSNILLDNHLNPVIGDFGLARLVLDDESHINTRVAGTIGYLAPEYITNGELTEKVDVFSFGVVTLEIITGKKNSSDCIVQQVWMLYQNQQQLELVDPKLGSRFSTEEVMRAMHIALLCVQEIPHLRPSMSSVTLLLSGNSNIVDIPTKPAFIGLTSERRESISSLPSAWNSHSISSSKRISDSQNSYVDTR